MRRCIITHTHVVNTSSGGTGGRSSTGGGSKGCVRLARLTASSTGSHPITCSRGLGGRPSLPEDTWRDADPRCGHTCFDLLFLIRMLGNALSYPHAMAVIRTNVKGGTAEKQVRCWWVIPRLHEPGAMSVEIVRPRSPALGPRILPEYYRLGVDALDQPLGCTTGSYTVLWPGDRIPDPTD